MIFKCDRCATDIPTIEAKRKIVISNLARRIKRKKNDSCQRLAAECSDCAKQRPLFAFYCDVSVWKVRKRYKPVLVRRSIFEDFICFSQFGYQRSADDWLTVFIYDPHRENI